MVSQEESRAWKIVSIEWVLLGTFAVCFLSLGTLLTKPVSEVLGKYLDINSDQALRQELQATKDHYDELYQKLRVMDALSFDEEVLQKLEATKEYAEELRQKLKARNLTEQEFQKRVQGASILWGIAFVIFLVRLGFTPVTLLFTFFLTKGVHQANICCCKIWCTFGIMGLLFSSLEILITMARFNPCSFFVEVALFTYRVHALETIMAFTQSVEYETTGQVTGGIGFRFFRHFGLIKSVPVPVPAQVLPHQVQQKIEPKTEEFQQKTEQFQQKIEEFLQKTQQFQPKIEHTNEQFQQKTEEFYQKIQQFQLKTQQFLQKAQQFQQQHPPPQKFQSENLPPSYSTCAEKSSNVV